MQRAVSFGPLGAQVLLTVIALCEFAGGRRVVGLDCRLEVFFGSLRHPAIRPFLTLRHTGLGSDFTLKGRAGAVPTSEIGLCALPAAALKLPEKLPAPPDGPTLDPARHVAPSTTSIPRSSARLLRSKSNRYVSNNPPQGRRNRVEVNDQ